MLTIDSKGPNRVDVTFTGKLDSGEMRKGLDQLIDSTRDIENGRMLYRITDFDLPTLGAIGVELARLPELLKMIRKIDRIAVLSDKEWVQKAGELEGIFIPALEIKGYDVTEEAAAEQWLAEID